MKRKGNNISEIEDEIADLDKKIKELGDEISALEKRLVGIEDPSEYKESINDGNRKSIENEIKEKKEELSNYELKKDNKKKVKEEQLKIEEKLQSKNLNETTFSNEERKTIVGKTFHHWFFGPVAVRKAEDYIYVEILDLDGISKRIGSEMLTLTSTGKNRIFRWDSINVWLFEESSQIYKSPSSLIERHKHKSYITA